MCVFMRQGTYSILRNLTCLHGFFLCFLVCKLQLLEQLSMIMCIGKGISSSVKINIGILICVVGLNVSLIWLIYLFIFLIFLFSLSGDICLCVFFYYKFTYWKCCKVILNSLRHLIK